jgi:uncharacterized protein YehS (DUF1456 family)
MTNNDIFRRVRYLFDINDIKTIELFKLTNCDIVKADVSVWLKKEDDPSFILMKDKELATFLNGLIIEKRGKREGPQPEPEEHLSNNVILMKLKIALNQKTNDILELFASVDTKIHKNELSAFFRNSNHRSYRPCLDQYIRRFLNALEARYKNKNK